MATVKATSRLQVGSTPWIAEERAAALQIAEAEAEEFAFSARNEVDWLNEHMAEIFSKNQVNVAEIFKTPGKLRGKTPRTAKKLNSLETRVPLSDVFCATPRGAASPFRQTQVNRPASTFQVAEDKAGAVAQNQNEPAPHHNPFDSGYFGSQFTVTQPTQPNERVQPVSPPKASAEESTVDVTDVDQKQETKRVEEIQHADNYAIEDMLEDHSPARIMSAPDPITQEKAESLIESQTPRPASPQKVASAAKSPASPAVSVPDAESLPIVRGSAAVGQSPQSPSEGSSPLRPVIRKSSLNFASLPAREPLTTKKSIGNRVSRTSQLDQNRTSHYGRHTGGKSLGNKQDDIENDVDDMDVDEPEAPVLIREDSDSKIRIHNKTSTQRLQDQISKLGQSQSAVRPPTKSLNNTAPQPPPQAVPKPAVENVRKESPRKDRSMIAPGAFPEDEDDSWIGPPTAAQERASMLSPRPQLVKSYSTDVMNGIRHDSVSGSQFSIPKRGDEVRQRSPTRGLPAPGNAVNSGHTKSASTSVIQSPKKSDSPGLLKTISVSNPNPSFCADDPSASPAKSLSRSYKGSPLKAAKDKFSSILKTSKGLFASSAAVSAEAKSSALTPGRLVNDVAVDMQIQPGEGLYPLLDAQVKEQATTQHLESPSKPSARKTRASTEKEERRKEAEAKAARDAKEARKANDKLEKARMKVEEEARIYRLEQQRVASMQQEVKDRKEQEKQAKASEVSLPRPTRTSPRKMKAQLEAEGVAAAAPKGESMDVEMQDASTMPPPAIPRPKSQIGRPGVKRPLKPAKETGPKAKPPTVIRVDTGSQRGHQYHPSNATLSATLQESLAPPPAPGQGTLRHKASNSSISSKASTNSFKSAASRVLEAAARKKEQDELAAQRKKEAKMEVERQRAAAKEEERRQQDLQRRREQERQREIQRERDHAASLADAKKAAARQAMEKRKMELEKAKQTGAPPPAARHHDGPIAGSQEKALPPVPREAAQSKPPRLPSTMQRQEESARPATTVLHNTTKAPPKRPLPQDGDEHHSRPTLQRNPASYQHNDAHTKRRKTSENFEDEDVTEDHPKMTAPPIRQSGIRQKACIPSLNATHANRIQDAPTKSLFPSGYTNAPQPPSLQRTTLISQHNMNQSKPVHPMDMAQVSKAPIQFASTAQPAGPSHKTPARPGGLPNAKSAKSTSKSSPRYQNGETIDLPEIPTDSEDEDSDGGGKNDFVALGWTNSPDLRRALALQETIDPAQVFGQPAPLNMEEVFNKSKDRFKKFRDRTSSANWSGVDGLTEEEVRKDLEARDTVRRQGGWSYDSMV